MGTKLMLLGQEGFSLFFVVIEPIDIHKMNTFGVQESRTINLNGLPGVSEWPPTWENTCFGNKVTRTVQKDEELCIFISYTYVFTYDRQCFLILHTNSNLSRSSRKSHFQHHLTKFLSPFFRLLYVLGLVF